MTSYTIINIAVLLILIALLYYLQTRNVSFTKRVFSGLGLGIALGTILHLCYGTESDHLHSALSLCDMIGNGYIKLLQMVVIPLIMVSIISAILQLEDGIALGKMTVLTLGVLLFTTMVAAGLGILMSNVFHLSAVGLTPSTAEVATGKSLVQHLSSVEKLSFSKLIVDFLPANPFLDMTGTRQTSTIAVVIFSIFVGLSGTGIAKTKPEYFTTFAHFIQIAQVIVMRIVSLVLHLTPYGILALVTKVVASSSWANMMHLVNFILASYSAIILMFGVHLLLLLLVGINPVCWIKKAFPVLAFAFTSRTSAGSIPMNVATQTRLLGIPASIANFSASLGATIGQNGCAGIYPAMLAVMIAPTVGVNPMAPQFIIPLMAIVTISSFGVAGVGGGATFAALMVLSALNFPVALAGLLISIEPLIDMGRTALNVSGSMVAGSITSRLLGQTDLSIFHSQQAVDLDDDYT